MEQSVAQRSGELRILLIDPHDDVRSALARRLRTDARVGSLVDVPRVADAWPLMDQSAPQVVLIDPGGWDAGGRDALRTLVKLRKRSAWFVIALHVARQDHFDALEARQTGADVYLLKGLRTADLVTALLRCLSSADAERAAK